MCIGIVIMILVIEFIDLKSVFIIKDIVLLSEVIKKGEVLVFFMWVVI